MYISPDFVKVSVKAKDVFAGYKTGCPSDVYDFNMYTGMMACPPTDPNFQHVSQNMLTQYPANPAQCYSTLNP